MRVSFGSRAAVVGAVALMACGSPSPSTNAGSAGTGNSAAGTSTGGGGTASSGGSGTAGGSAGQASSGNGAGGSATTTTRFGQVLLQSLVGGTGRVSVSARFQSGSEPGTETSCVRVSDGPCTASTCDEAPDGGTKPIFVSAGTVTVTSTDVAGTATLLPDATNQYPSPSTSPFEKQFVGGEHVQVKASGATVPAFADELSVPLVLLLSQPLFVKGQPSLDAPRSQDLSLVWTRGAKDVYFYLTGSSARTDGLPGMAYLTCQIPSEAGSAVIKSSLLQLLAADTPFIPFTISTKVLTAGEYSITLATTLPVANPDKDLIPRIVLK
jgi:hypothetical protein